MTADRTRQHVRPIDALILVAFLVAFGTLIADGHFRSQGLATADVAAWLARKIYRFLGRFYL